MFQKIFSLLRRETGNKKFVAEVDGLRSLALIPVILLHFNTNYKRNLGEPLGDLFEGIVGHGNRGVLLFFAISGFILAFGFYNIVSKGGEINYKDYFLRRLTRLEPPYIISTLLLFFFVQFSFSGGWQELTKHLIPTLTYTHNLIFGYWSPINPVTWSLEVEIQFYLLIPIFSVFLFKKSQNFRFLLLLALIVCLPFLVMTEESPFMTNNHLKRSLPMYITHFLIGVIFLNIYVSSFWSKIRSSYYWDITGILAIIIYLAVDLGDNRPVAALLLDCIILLIFISAFKGLVLNKLFTNPLLVIFGGMCYSIYLMHYAIFYGLSKIQANLIFSNNLYNYLFHFIVSFLCMFVLSAIFFVLFEKPFMRKNWWKRKNKGNQSMS